MLFFLDFSLQCLCSVDFLKSAMVLTLSSFCFEALKMLKAKGFQGRRKKIAISAQSNLLYFTDSGARIEK